MNKDLFNQAYREGEELVPDYVYDAILDANEAELDEERPSGDLIDHLYPMLSLPTFFFDIPTLSLELLYKNAKLNKADKYNISFKYDGVSASFDYVRDPDNYLNFKFKCALSRGKRFAGFKIPQKLINRAKIVLKPDLGQMVGFEQFSIRGEFVMKKCNLDICNQYLIEHKIHEPYTNTRAIVAGMIGSDDPCQFICDHIDFIAHGFHSDANANFHFNALTQALHEDFINIGWNVYCKSDELVQQAKLLYFRAMTSDYPCDGIVIQHNHDGKYDSKVYMDRIAVKQFDEAKYSGKSKVTKIEWRMKSNGSYFPLVHLDSENINQAKASNRMFVDEDSIGYVWIPDILGFPETIEDVEFYEKWFPLETEVPKELSDYVLECIKKRHEGEDYQDDGDSWSGGFADNH